MAITFASTKYLEHGDASAADFGTGDFSVAGWFRHAAFAANSREIVGKRAACGNENFWAVSLANDGTVVIETDEDALGTNYGYRVSAATGLDDGLWHQFVCTRSGTNLSIYIAGVLSNGATGVPAAATNLTNANGLQIGRSGGNAGACLDFVGDVEDVRIYARVLTAQEAASLAGGYRGPLGGEVGWWTMDGAQAIAHFDGATLTLNTNYIPDQSLNTNNGNPTGSPVGAASAAPRAGGITD